MDPNANLREQEEIENVLCYANAREHRELWPRLLDLRPGALRLATQRRVRTRLGEGADCATVLRTLIN